MPRKSAASLAVISLDVTGKSRLRAPEGLSEAARAIFVDLVASVDAKHFTRSDLPLLVEYASACAMARQAAEALEREGPIVAGRANPWNVVLEKQVRSMVALSMRLRLAPQSRIDSRGAGRSSKGAGTFGIDSLSGIGGDSDEA